MHFRGYFNARARIHINYYNIIIPGGSFLLIELRWGLIYNFISNLSIKYLIWVRSLVFLRSNQLIALGKFFSISRGFPFIYGGGGE